MENHYLDRREAAEHLIEGRLGLEIHRPTALCSYFAERDRSFRVSVTAGGMLNE